MVLTPSPVDSWEEHGPLRIVLLCAEKVSPLLEGLLETLHARDVDFDYVPGVELDSRLALQALEHHQDDALYVICQDENLDDFSAAHVQDTLLRACSVGSTHFLTLPLQPGRTATQARALATRAELMAPTVPGDSRAP
jgi:hypothetical protein